MRFDVENILAIAFTIALLVSVVGATAWIACSRAVRRELERHIDATTRT